MFESSEAARILGKKRAEQRGRPERCPVCNKPVINYGREGMVKYCSPKCKYLARRARARAAKEPTP